MKLPIIRQIQRTCSAEQIESAIAVLESVCESPSVKDEELDLIGELISNCCGALEVKQMIAEGADEKTALNGFMGKVLGSIDR
ncbi:MAG TPA: hypothetical protein VIK80_03430 [Flavihumibacter sp.]|jgi:hypothetical protein